MAGALTKAGRYQIIAELGRGSMGVVYQGFDPIIGRTVAIKTMLTEGLAPAEFQEFKARFQREAQAAGALTHPNIVTVYDFGEDAGILYLAMELLEGKSVEKLVEEQHLLPIETIIPMYEQVCSALDHAHAHKIVHRDIKPANIMILDSGLVKVTDFGIAKMMSMGMTQAGQILGTPNYMSPEQVKGRPIDGRSDIFSLGVILYELVTGEKPFGGQNITTVIYKIINENPIPPRELDATIHPGLSYVIAKALAKNPEERYQTCRELAEDLKNYKNLGGATAPSATVVFKVPPPEAVAPPAPPPAPVQAARPAPVEPQPVRPMSVHVIPPARAEQHATSPVVWVLLTLVVVGLLGGGYYFFLRGKGEFKTAESNPPPATQPLTPTTTASTPTGGATPAGTTTEAPATQTPTAAAATENKPAVQPPEQRAEASKGGEATRAAGHMPPGGTSRSGPAPKFGQLLVTSNVPGASISIDGRSQSGWATPFTFADMPAGTHMVLVTKDGYSPVQQSVTVEGGRTNSLNAQLAMPSGEINIVTNPPGAEILIDGKSYGASPVRATVGVGQHSYTVKRPGMEPFSSTFTMKDQAIITRKVDLGGAVSAAPTGIVEVRTIPPGAVVYADGTPVGGQTPTSFRLTPGRHTLTIALSGYRPLRREIDVPANGSVPVNEILPRQ
jgi:serine/threonine-protein kinase